MVTSGAGEHYGDDTPVATVPRGRQLLGSDPDAPTHPIKPGQLAVAAVLALLLGVVLLGAQLWVFSVFSLLLAGSFGALAWAAFRGSTPAGDP